MRISIVLATAVLASILLGGVVGAETIVLRNGDQLEGLVILESDDERIVAEHPVLGRIVIPKDAIEPPAPAETPVVTPGLFGTDFLAGLTRAVSAGLTGSSGKSRNLNFNADLKVTGEREHHRDRFVARYYLSTEDGESNANEFEVTHDHDFLFPGSAWLIFVGGGYRFDDFQVWTHRLTSRTGVGYEFWNTETWLVSGRVGGGLMQKFDRNRTSPEGVVGIEAAWTISEGHRVTTSHFYFPSLNDLPAFRSLSRIEWRIPVGLVPGLAMKLGGSYEYDSAIRSPANNDRKYYGNVSYDF